jgi:hypothetical protein
MSVAESNGVGTAVTDQSAVLISSSTITLDSVELNIQLGAEPQGAMIRMQNTTIGGGLSIANTSINDTSLGGGSIFIGTTTVKDWDNGTGFGGLATADLSIGDVLIDVVAGTGLQVQLVDIGELTACTLLKKIFNSAAPRWVISKSPVCNCLAPRSPSLVTKTGGDSLFVAIG